MTKFLSSLPKTTTKSEKRLGRGIGSGVGGHTVGRGQKGQKSRRGGKVGLMFTGTKNKKSLIQRLPILRGKNKFKSLDAKPLIIRLDDLNKLPQNAEVTIETLVQYKLIKAEEARRRGVKILNTGELSHALSINVPVSQGAQAKIEAAGGKVL